MNIQEIIERVRDRTQTTPESYSDDKMLKVIEDASMLVRTEIINRVDESFLYDIFTTDTVAGQREYSLSKRNATEKQLQKVLSVQIKKTANSGYVPLQAVGVNALIDLEKMNGCFDVRDNSIFLSDAPREAVAQGLRVEALCHPPKLTLASTAEDIGVPHEVQEVLITVAKMLVYEIKKMHQEYRGAMEDLVGRDSPRGWNWMTRTLTDRVSAPLEIRHIPFNIWE